MTANDIKYLEFLQSSVARMAGNSFLAKGRSITLTTAVLGFAIKDGDPSFALIGLLPVTLFWLLDAYYLALERKFRDLYTKAVPAFVANRGVSFSISPGSIKFRFWIAMLFRPAVFLVHAPMAAVLIIVYMVLRNC